MHDEAAGDVTTVWQWVRQIKEAERETQHLMTYCKVVVLALLCCLARHNNNELWLLYWNPKKSECSSLSVYSGRGGEYVWSVTRPWQQYAAHKFSHFRGHHKIWMDSVAIPTDSPDLAPSDYPLFGHFKKPGRAAECHAPVVTEEGGQLWPGRNMYSCTMVVEDCQQRRGLIVEITMPQQCCSEVFDIFLHPTCK